jgi:hypothetical protein
MADVHHAFKLVGHALSKGRIADGSACPPKPLSAKLLEIGPTLIRYLASNDVFNEALNEPRHAQQFFISKC